MIRVAFVTRRGLSEYPPTELGQNSSTSVGIHDHGKLIGEPLDPTDQTATTFGLNSQ